MSQSFSSVSSGTTSASAVKTETDKMSDYLRGQVLSADIDAGSLERRHVYKPEAYGFPMHRSRGPGHLLGSVNTVDHQDHRVKRQRELIMPAYLSQDEDHPVRGAMATINLPRRAYVSVQYYLSAFDARNPDYDFDGTPDALYASTNGTLADWVGGTFVLKSRDHSDGSVTVYRASTSQCHMTKGVNIHYRKCNGLARMTLAAGIHDIYVAYEPLLGNSTTVRIQNVARDAGDAGVLQVIVGDRGLTWEAFYY